MMRRDLHVALIKIDMPIAVHRHNINLRINFMCQLLNLSQCMLTTREGRGGGRETGGGGREKGGGGREEGGGGKGRKCEPISPTPGQSLDPQLVVFNSYL